MRQVGILAAACLYGLDHNVERLEVDHQNAKRLSHGLAGIDGIQIDSQKVVTNIVLFDVGGTPMDATTFSHGLALESVLVIPFGPTTVRAVTHLDVSSKDIDRALEIIGSFVKSSSE